MDSSGVKRKRPPTFQHLPFNRAKKLKQKWVETVKIKSKWKAQRRKEGAVAGPMNDGSEAGSGEVASNDDAQESEEDEQNSDEDVNEPTKESDAASGPSSRPTISHAKSYMHPSQKERRQAQLPRRAERSKNNSNPSELQPTQTTSLRDLTREAYSKSSLHTYKSDPLNRRSGPGSRGKDRRRGGGRGQPNMKLRMDAMLEKIKRDLT
ncbi:hypothetical protein BD779DRAFT_1669150 [Infundibulicybe gibba]|nr:hypothetical protein BD779DRAFT_1669150 [Infundibulicybe gibba]